MEKNSIAEALTTSKVFLITDVSRGYSNDTDRNLCPVEKSFLRKCLPDVWGKPEATIDAIIKLIDSPDPPLRLLLGKVAYTLAKKNYEKRLAGFEEWKEVSEDAHGS